MSLAKAAVNIEVMAGMSFEATGWRVNGEDMIEVDDKDE